MFKLQLHINKHFKGAYCWQSVIYMKINTTLAKNNSKPNKKICDLKKATYTWLTQFV